MRHLTIATLLLAFTFGCSGERKPAANATNIAKPSDAAQHAHGAGPNGGVVFDFGGLHAEFTVDHDKQQCAILILGEDEKTPTPVTAKEIVLLIKETKTSDGKAVAPMTITMQPADAADGKAAKYVGADRGLGNVADFQGTLSGDLNGKPASGDFKE
jgi:hypothetical protein